MWFAQQSITPVLESTDSTVVITSGDTASAGLFAGMMLMYTLVVFTIWIISVIALWKIFVKAGVEGWKSIIPIYNYWVLCEIVGRPGWWGLVPLLMVIPCILSTSPYPCKGLQSKQTVGRQLGFPWEAAI